MLDPDTGHVARHAIADAGVRINRMAIAATGAVASPHTPRHAAPEGEVSA